MKFLSALFGFLICSIAAIFALSNRQSVTFSLWPFDVAITAPLFMMTLGAFALGLLFGGVFVWFGSISHRLMARRLGKSVELLGDKIQELERELAPHRARLAAEQSETPSKINWKFWRKR